MVLRTLTNVPFGTQIFILPHLPKPELLGIFGEHNILSSVDGNASHTYEFTVLLYH